MITSKESWTIIFKDESFKFDEIVKHHIFFLFDLTSKLNIIPLRIIPFGLWGE